MDTMNVTAPHGVRRLAPAAIQEFLLHEADLLSEHRFEEWLSLYTDDCVYWMPAEHGQTDPDTRASLYYDDRQILVDRIGRLRHPRMYSQRPAARQSRLVSNMVLGEDSTDAAPIVHSRFVMFESRLGQNKTYGGALEHHLRRTGDSWKIAKKIVRLANCDDVLANIGIPI